MNIMLIWLVAGELALGVIAGVWFMVVYALGPWRRTAAGRHMMAVTAVMAAEMLALLLLIGRVRVPLWVFAVVFAAADVVVVHRLVLLHRSRQRDVS